VIILLYVCVCVCLFVCAAVCCSVLQCVAVCCSVLQCDAVCCSVLQCVAVCCSVCVGRDNLEVLCSVDALSLCDPSPVFVCACDYVCVLQCVAV